jgi:hypothetical protein
MAYPARSAAARHCREEGPEDQVAAVKLVMFSTCPGNNRTVAEISIQGGS